MRLINDKNRVLKLKKYRQLFSKFLSLKDEFGGIDKKILKIVILLNLINITTISSCEGYTKNNSPLPYIKIAPKRKTKNYKNIIKKYELQIRKLLKLFYKKRKVKLEAKLTITYGNYGFWIHSNKKLFLKWRKIINQQVLNNKNKKINKAIKSKVVKSLKIKKRELAIYQKEFKLFTDFLFDYYLNKK